MQEAWIPLVCAECTHRWTPGPSELPPPGATHTCPACGEQAPITAFVSTQEGLKMLREFHGG